MSKQIQVSAIESLRESIGKIETLVMSLPEETIRWKPSEDEWSIMQIMTHIVEAIPYWGKEIKNIKSQPDQPWGRGLIDEVRLLAVSKENVTNLSVEIVVQQLHSIPPTVEKVLTTLTSEDLALKAPSRNPRFDGKPIEFIVNHLIVEHAEKHYSQMKRNVSKYNQQL
ncbi:DinB family protein [Neobacillus sp. WH10]|uniref:DinB family protein n=1 Tax=Neobacillus sp. WH10 TaxID=3047873 RepID=UPI0024C13BC0|nr:DinB family protein [Neobacillus sp. WH10]WHY78571.1 DinB family protein [Neobacillus sp. WH10]